MGHQVQQMGIRAVPIYRHAMRVCLALTALIHVLGLLTVLPLHVVDMGSTHAMQWDTI